MSYQILNIDGAVTGILWASLMSSFACSGLTITGELARGSDLEALVFFFSALSSGSLVTEL